MPAYNEAATIERVVLDVLRLPIVQEVVVVDDGSTDDTAKLVEAIEDSRVKLLRQPSNAGKTAAIVRAVEIAQGEILIVQDADLEYDPREIPHVIAPILEGRADVVYGSRFMVRRAARVLYFYHYLANQMLTTLSNLFTNLNMTDIETGYKAFRAEILKAMPLKSEGFGMEVEITASVAQLPLRIYEVPISYYGRTYEEGKKVGVVDGLHALWYILYFNTVEKNSPERRSFRSKVRLALKP